MEAFVAIGHAFNQIFGKLSFICSQTMSMMGALGDCNGWWTIVAVLFKIMSMWKFIVHIKESQIIFSKLKCISCFNRLFSKFSSRSNLGWVGLLKHTL